MSSHVDTVVLDLDGTLVDSVYVHTLAWKAAFRDVGVDVPAHRIHRGIGMGGDRLVAHLTSDAVEAAVGDTVRDQHARHLDERFHEIVPTDGAVELLAGLRAAGLDVVLASSGGRELTHRLLDLVDGADTLVHEVLTGSDADRSKPSGELVARAVEAGGGRAVVVGDAVWDVAAAHEAGLPCWGLLSGGFSEAELREAGAVAVFASARELADGLDAALADLAATA
ncbi:HAD family hydrolase [Nocardioides sp. KIGAM211]|uniref:HAD family hydrolase n=1 Tax=Nocardioides luti TaxID=2761101 RepID=A0A7X0VC18_9ACTN|nr:HAD family hydrolase [Nocardioides luti]MBB6627778.1 HAD family hydrolase [Nocardioides luti]